MNELDLFGKLIAEDLRDSILDRYNDLESSWIASKEAKQLSERLRNLLPNERETVRAVVNDVVVAGIHEFLVAIQEGRHAVQITVEDVNVSEVSDGLPGEIFSEDGWFAKFSKYGEHGI